jgi:quercetin dioxygenase-like cupin family protein
MTYSRRDLALLLPALAAAQQAPRSAAPSKAFLFRELTPKPGGAITTYQILTGETHTGFPLDLHESELAAGAEPHPPHAHVHEELVLVREGELDVTIAGRKTRLGAGSGAYIASNDLHGYRNSGSVPARYFVLALGQD